MNVSAACPVAGLADPLVQGLLGSTDCGVRQLVTSGYAALFAPTGAFVPVLTVLMTLVVALIGYRLLLGRTPLNLSEIALTAVKLAAVLALATRWTTYQTLVLGVLFEGPLQLGDVLLHLEGMSKGAPGLAADLQKAFDDLSQFSPAAPADPAHRDPFAASNLAPNPAAGLITQAGFDALIFQISAALLLISSLGPLLVAKIVLGVLLALGPVFLACLLFDATRGLFEGWLRSCVAAALTPLFASLLLALSLSLTAVEVMHDREVCTPGVAIGVLVITVLSVGGAVCYRGLRLDRTCYSLARTRARSATLARAQGAIWTGRLVAKVAAPSRPARLAAAAAAQSRRDLERPARAAGELDAIADRRNDGVAPDERVRSTVPAPIRLGQEPRRRAQPSLSQNKARERRDR